MYKISFRVNSETCRPSIYVSEINYICNSALTFMTATSCFLLQLGKVWLYTSYWFVLAFHTRYAYSVSHHNIVYGSSKHCIESKSITNLPFILHDVNFFVSFMSLLGSKSKRVNRYSRCALNSLRTSNAYNSD